MPVSVQRSDAVILSMQESLWPRLDAIASNLSNASTVGFRALTSGTKEIPQGNKGDFETISYVVPDTLQLDTKQGPIRLTQNPFDVAIQGDGFFQVQGGFYTRNGQFQLSSDGKLVTSQGKAVLGDGGSELNIPTDVKSISISSDGTISSEKGVNLGKIGLVNFANPKTLKSIGHNLYTSPQPGTPDLTSKVVQGGVEDSNVDTIGETIKMLEINRLYEQAQKALEAEDERQRKIINLSARNAA